MCGYKRVLGGMRGVCVVQKKDEIHVSLMWGVVMCNFTVFFYFASPTKLTKTSSLPLV